MKLSSFFKKIERNDEVIYFLSDDAPEWLQNAVYKAHLDQAPNNWIFEQCYYACLAIDDNSFSDEDYIYQHADNHVDEYTKLVHQWSADMCLGSLYAYAAEEAENFFDKDITKNIQLIQYHAILFIVQTILDAYKEQKEQDEQSEVEDDE